MQAQKKIAQTDEIFSYVDTATRIADETEGVIRISQYKANVKVGPFSGGGYGREGKASDMITVGNGIKAFRYFYQPMMKIIFILQIPSALLI